MPGGDVHASIMDLGRFGLEHPALSVGRDRVLCSEVIRELHTEIGDNYGLEWYVRESGSHHLGGTGTFLSTICLSAERDVAVVVATNADLDAGLVSDTITELLALFQIPPSE